MCAAENRPRYNRDRLRYPSDLTDEEWALIAPLIPPGDGPGKRIHQVFSNLKGWARGVYHGSICARHAACSPPDKFQ